MDDQTQNDQAKTTTQSHDQLPKVAQAKQLASVSVDAHQKPQREPGGEPKRAGFFRYAFIVLSIAVIGFGGGWLGARSYQDEAVSQDTQRVVLDNQGDLISSIAEEVGQSAVSVSVTSVNGGGFSFLGFSEGVESESAGSGFIISEDGLVVTNRHVVPENATNVALTLADGTEFDNVEIVGRTAPNDPLDIAFLQIRDLKGRDLVPAKLGDSNAMQVGESVIAIGNALGQFSNTVTTGIVSAYGRSVVARDASGTGETLEDLFQTDAAINQGNSGGPLVNIRGEVIGINTAVADSAENIGFAIPINNIRGLIRSVEETGELRRAYMGVVYVPVNSELVSEYGLGVEEGAFIPPADDFGRDTVVDGSPAAEAGIQEGDVITKVGDIEITSRSGLASALGQFSSGETVRVVVNRDGRSETINLTLGEAPNN